MLWFLRLTSTRNPHPILLQSLPSKLPSVYARVWDNQMGKREKKPSELNPVKKMKQPMETKVIR